MATESEQCPTLKMIGDALGYQVNILSDVFGAMKVIYAVPHKSRYCNKTFIVLSELEKIIATGDTDSLSTALLDNGFPHLFVSQELNIEQSYEALKEHVFATYSN